MGYPLVFMDVESAEMTKYAANAFLAMKITFINEMAGLCEKVGADISHISLGMGLDKRIGDRFLQAGPGYGGSCFPKDTLAIARTGQNFGHRLRLIETTIEVNDAIKERMVERVLSGCGGTLAGKRLLVLGVTFKANTDDMRDAPSLTIIPELLKRGATVCVVDPQGRKEGEELLPGVSWCDDVYEGARGSDALVVLTEWPQFTELALPDITAVMSTRTLIDLRNLFSEQSVQEADFDIHLRLGRGEYSEFSSENVVAI